ncbi:hypothetical protein [Virgibacillus salexigens]|uniref:hypothetical protein n=1 Tax=Virgibacillus salexigens TaxID=61016 RepID=UPI00190C6FB0|nr:hypothetical protein [Virgibacillus salexigens]
MTVNELIKELLDYDMESEVEIVGNVNSRDYEIFQDFSVDEDYQITGKGRVSINFSTGGMAFIDEDRLEKLEDAEQELEEMEELNNG